MKKLSVLLVLAAMFLCGCTNYVEDGSAHLKKGENMEAIKDFTSEIEDEGDLAEAYRGIGLAWYAEESYDTALEAFEIAIEKGAKETAEICSLMAACEMQLQEYEDAIVFYEKALTKKGISKELKQEVKFNLIAAYEFLGDWETAKEKMKEYVEQYPNDTRVEKEAEFLETR